MDYIDSCVFIGAYIPSDPNHEKCKKHMEKIKSGKIKAITSTFTLAEVGGFISRNSKPKDALRYMEELVKIPNLYFWSTDDFDELMNVIISLSLKFGLSGADSMHVVAATSTPDVKRIVTLDQDFKKVEEVIPILMI